MTDQGTDREPPRINLDDLTSPAQPKADVPEDLLAAPTGSDAPPKLKLQRPAPHVTMAQKKKETTRIDLSDAQPKTPPPAPKPPAAPIPLKLVTSKKAKEETTRIDLSEAKPPAPTAEQEEQPAGIQESVPKDVADAAKMKTIKIDAIDDSDESLEDVYKAALERTQRVSLDEKQVDTAALEKAEAREAEKKATARVNLKEFISKEDEQEMLKKRTLALDDSAVVAPPKRKSGTIRIEPASTAQIEAMGLQAPPPDLDESRKSETARIEVPRDAVGTTKPPSQRKTIRIKRPDGTSAVKPMPIARAPAREEPKFTASEAGEEQEESAGTLFTVLALVATLVVLVLLYVLTATLYPGVPFPGRLV